MPGLVGIVEDAPLDRLSHDLDQMITPMLRRPEFQVDRQTLTGAALAGIRLGPEPSLSTCPGITLVAAGLVFQTDELLSRLALEDHPSWNPISISDLLLSLYRDCGIGGLSSLNGTYVAAIWEEDPRRLTLINDRFGAMSLYYWHSASRLMFSNEYKAISWHRDFDRKLDDVAIADLFVYVTAQSNRTLFSNIRSLPPASFIIYQNGELNIYSYWKPSFASLIDDQKSEATFLDEFDTFLRQAVSRRIHPNLAIPITGGLDSRIITGMIQQIAPDLPVRTNTIGIGNSRDVVIGGEVSHALGYPHDWIPLNEEYYALYAATAAWRSEGKLLANAAWIYALEAYLRHNQLQYVMTGLFGNFISGRHYPSYVPMASTLDRAVVFLQSRLSPYINQLKKVLRPGIYQRVIPESLGWEEEIFRSIDTPNPTSRFDYLYLRSIIPHVPQSFDIFGDAALTLEPFIDNDLVDFIIKVPPPLRMCGTLYKKLIVERIPKVAGIMYGRTGHSLKHDLLISQSPWLEHIDYLQRQLLNKIWPENKRKLRTTCIPFAESIRGQSRQFVLDVLSQSEYLEDYFDMAAVNDLVDDHIAGKINAYRSISALVTFSLWRQMFCQGTENLCHQAVESVHS